MGKVLIIKECVRQSLTVCSYSVSHIVTVCPHLAEV